MLVCFLNEEASDDEEDIDNDVDDDDLESDDQVSISATFYEQLFQTKGFFEVFLYLQHGLVIVWQNNIGYKSCL